MMPPASPDAFTVPPAADPFAVPPAAAGPAARALSAVIRDRGPIPFADFMALALYHPQHGYYRRGRPTAGRDGDFLTSPEVHPLFTYAVAGTIASVWERLGQPPDFTVRDVGPGTGAFAEDLLTWADSHRPDLAAVMRVDLVEPSPGAAARQQERLAAFRDRLSWRADAATAPPLTGVLFSNELLDAQPVHRLRWRNGAWQELLVGIDDQGRFQDVPAPPSDVRLLAPLRGLSPTDGQVVEVSLALAPLVRSLADTLSRGLLLLFDYGYPRARLYAPWRRDGTLMTFRRHMPGSDPYAAPGETDLTCHVDLDTVRETAQAAGLEAFPLWSQAEYLAATGALTTARAAARAAPKGRGADLEASLQRRRAADILSDPAGLGRIQVLAFRRRLPGPIHGLDAAAAIRPADAPGEERPHA